MLLAFTIAGGLALDQYGGVWGQALVNLWAWGVFFLLYAHSANELRPALIACLIIATLGEVVLSLVWGLYDYRLGNLPLFVPPGHVLLYMLGMWLADRLPAKLLSVIPWIAASCAVLLVFVGKDYLSLPLTGLLLLAYWRGPAPKLYATMFVLALAMELWGTALGNWAWRLQVPGLGWPTLNPPFAAGAFYCVLDYLVGVTVTSGYLNFSRRAPESAS